MQEFIQSLLEEEVIELLGRRKSERRKMVDGSPAYRNGRGKKRKLTLGYGKVTLYRPWVKDWRSISRAGCCLSLLERAKV